MRNFTVTEEVAAPAWGPRMEKSDHVGWNLNNNQVDRQETMNYCSVFPSKF